MPQGEYLQYGGQAIFEGVMMRSPRFFSVACRAPNGEIITQTEALEKTWIGRQKWLKFPFLRGTLALLDAMALGIKAMRFASNVQLDLEYQKPEDREKLIAEAEANAKAKGGANPTKDKKIQDAAVGMAMFTGLAMGVLLFVLLPNWLAEAFGGLNPLQKNLAAGIIKIVVFLGYLAGIGQMAAIKDVFRYHGAEHKAINALEAEQELSNENCQAQTRLHPRCGTSFAVIVLIVSLFVFTFVPRYPLGQQAFGLFNVLIRVGLELLILPLIAGISYELLRLAGKFRNQGLVNLAFKPGVWTQFLTTREPRPDQIEVALIALKNVLRAEKEGLNVEPHEDALESAPLVP
jgi:uncharacterized protein YqhQ